MPHDVQTPLRVCYVVSYFHPFESGAERQALAQGALARPPRPHRSRHHQGHPRLSRRGRRTPRCLHPSLGENRLRRPSLRRQFPRRHHQRPPPSPIRNRHRFTPIRPSGKPSPTGLARPLLRGKPTLVQPASAGYYGEAEELARTRGSPPSSARSWQTPPSPRSPPRSSASGSPSACPRAAWSAPPAASMPTSSAPAHPRSKTVSSRAPACSSPGVSTPRKTCPLLLEAWSAIAPKRSGSLILVGPGNDRQRLESPRRLPRHRRPRPIHRRRR